MKQGTPRVISYYGLILLWGLCLLPVGGYFTKYLVGGISTWTKNWTQSDLRFCENEGPKRSKINENAGQLDWKSRRKLIQNAWNVLTITFWWKIWPNLILSISGTNCDIDNPIFAADRGVNRIGLRNKIGTQSDWKSQKWGIVSHGSHHMWRKSEYSTLMMW